MEIKMVDDTRQASIDACLGLRNDVYPCREDISEELWGKKIFNKQEEKMVSEEDIKSLDITKWQDNEDGSADVEFTCSKTLRNFLAGQGLIYVIRQMIKDQGGETIEFKEGAENHPNVDR
jgi:hypothetical protein